MQKAILILLSSLFLFSCSKKIMKEDAIFDPKKDETPQIIAESDNVLNIATRIFLQENYYVELYTQNENKGLVKVDNFENLSPEFIASYNLIRYKSGEIMYVAEFPYAKSGNWENIYESVFDKEGYLLKFIRKSSFVQDNRLVSEKSEYYYNKKHELIKKTYEIKDHKDRPINDITGIDFKYRLPYEISLTRKKWLKAHGLEK